MAQKPEPESDLPQYVPEARPVADKQLRDLTETTSFTPLRTGERMSAATIGNTNPYLATGYRLYRELPNGADPERLGPGTVTGIVGEGILTRVYRVLCESPRENRAIKVALPDLSWDLSQALLRRWLHWARLDHPAIVTAHDVGEHNGLPYVELEHVSGTSLDSCGETGEPFPPHVAAAIAICVAEALSHNQTFPTQGPLSQQVVPRVAPDDIAIDHKGQLKLLDLMSPAEMGLLATVNPDRAADTMRYLAPEVLASEGSIPHAGVYTVGALLYHLVTGAPADLGSTALELIEEKRHEVRVPLKFMLRKAKRQVAALACNCLSPATDRRPQSLKVLCDELRRILARQTTEPAEEIVRHLGQKPGEWPPVVR